MRLLSNLHVKGKPAVLPDRAICGQSHYFIYRPRIYTFPPPLPAGLITAPHGHTTSYWLCHFPAPTQPGMNTMHNRATDILHSPAYEDGTDSEFRNGGN